jgi:hypothetical protein
MKSARKVEVAAEGMAAQALEVDQARHGRSQKTDANEADFE